MTKFLVLDEVGYRTPAELECYLEGFAGGGWELVAILPGVVFPNARYVFRRTGNLPPALTAPADES